MLKEKLCPLNPQGLLFDSLSTTLGPAKPIRAFGSAIIISPSMAKLAVTPPNVGSVKIDIYGTPISEERYSGAGVPSA